VLTDYYVPFATATLLAAALSWWSPIWALMVLLAALPFFTHHPGSAPTALVIILVAVVELVYVLRARPSWAGTWRAISSQPLLLLSTLFVAAAALSLSSLPLGGIWSEHAATARTQPLAAWPLLGLDWLLLTEGRREFPIKSAVLTLQAVVLAIIVWRETRASSVAALRLSAAITLGTVVFVALGLLEMAGVVSLHALRGTGGVFFREGTLQSASGNPGWFSQYVVYALPHALVLLAGLSAVGLRVALLCGVAGMMAFALLVSFQRGGWVTGAVVLIYMTTAALMLLTRARGSSRTARQHVARALALVGVFLVLVSVGFAYWMARTGQGGTAFTGRVYLARLKSIADADRLSYVRAGSMIAALHPALGGGHESFAYRYHMYFGMAGGPYHRSSVRVPEAASAHNLFVQTLAGTGLVGAALLVSIFVVAAWTAVRACQAPVTEWARRVALLAGCGSLLGIACYGLVQEVFYVHALRLFFFVCVGLVAGVGARAPGWPGPTSRALWLALAGAFVVHLAYEYAWPGPGRLLGSGEPTGLHAEEVGRDGVHFQWSTDWATWPVPPGATRYALQVRSAAPYAQHIAIEPCRGARAHVFLSDQAWHPVGGSLEGCAPGDRLQLHVTPAWRVPGESRLLGVLTAGVHFR
jgi:hypothetical protein